MGAYGRTPWFRRLARADRAAARAALARVGLEAEAGERFGALSGGQRQRVLIARALVQDAPVLLLDEPLSGVDAPSAARIEALFEELRGEGRTLLVATHDARQARAWQRVLCLNRAPGRLRRPRRGADPRRPAGDLRRRARRPRRRLDRGRRRAPRALMLARPDHPPRAARGADPRARARPARRLGAAAPPGLRGRVAQPRPAARARARRARRRSRSCSAPPAARSSPPARSRSPAATSASAPTSASPSRSRRCSGSARCSRSRPTRRRGSRSCCSATCWGSRAPTSPPPPGSRSPSRSRSPPPTGRSRWPPSTAPPRARSARGRRAGRRRCSRCSASARSRRRPGSAACCSSRS